jgi:pimeloyl-ACP methyl ester carboxylesterase
MAAAPALYEYLREPGQEPEMPNVNVTLDRMLAHGGVVGGLGTSPQEQWLYDLILHHESSPLPAEDRYLPPEGRGLIPFDEMVGRMEEDIEELTERVEGPVALTTHSLGAHLGMAVALRRPELFQSFVSLGGVGCGVQSLTPVDHVIKAFLRKAAGVEDIMRGSDYMRKHERKVATEWSPDIPVLLVATPYDELAPFSDTLGIELPPGQTAEKRVIAPDVPGMHWFLRKVMGMPEDATIVHSKLPALHALLPRHHAAIEQDRQVRWGSLSRSANFMVSAADTTPRPILVSV